jgi:hypothetical protein
LAVTGISGSTNAGAIIGQFGAAGNTNYGADNALFLTNGTGVHQTSYDGIDYFGLEFTAQNGDHIAVYNQSKTGPNFTYYDFTTGTPGESLTLTNVTDVNCFAAGTGILTLADVVPVESIKVGETVVILLNDIVSTSRVIWTGKRHVDIARAPDQDEARPIRICAGAIADGIPERDLRVSARHGLYIDGYLFEARSLVNGTTIFQEQNTRRVTYHHIELEEHAIIFAEGCMAESYLETGNRAAMESAGVVNLRPTPQGSEIAKSCVPLVLSGEHLARVQQRLADRARSVSVAA